MLERKSIKDCQHEHTVMHNFNKPNQYSQCMRCGVKVSAVKVGVTNESRSKR